MFYYENFIFTRLIRCICISLYKEQCSTTIWLSGHQLD
jgi:hypothetical protein